MEQSTRSCPECKAVVPEHYGYTSWCECGWNLRPHRPSQFPTFVERMSVAYGDRVARSLFESMQGRVPKVQLTLSKALAFAIAGLVHLSSLLLVVTGAWLLISFWPNVLAIAGAVASLGIAWIARPRLRKPPENPVSRAHYPELYALVDEVAALLGHRQVKGVALIPEFNAYYTTAGLRGDAYISIGLPLWRVLSPQERAGLLGHEIGHGVNGDVQRGAFVGSAVSTLVAWYYLIIPDSIFGNEAGGPGLFMIPFNLLMAGLAQIPYGVSQLLLILMLRDSQRAEYLADFLESTVSGTEAALSGLEKLHYRSTFQLASQRAAVRNDSPFFATLDQLMREVPKREIERVRRVTLMENSRIDTSHPPTALRCRFIQEQQVTHPQLVIDDERDRRINAELSAAYDQCERVVVDRYRARLYA